MARNVQIALVGAQPMPIYNGYVYLKPEKMILLHSRETEAIAKRLKAVITCECTLKEIEKPFDYFYCKDIIEKQCINETENILSFNISGGSKIMTLTAFEIAKEKQIAMFFIDQNNAVTDFVSEKSFLFKDTISLSIYFQLFGQSAKSSVLFEDIDKELFVLKNKIINDVFNFLPLFKKIRSKRYNEKSNFLVKNKKYELQWKQNTQTAIFYIKASGIEEHITGSNHFHVLFNTGWFELYVLEIISKWKMAKQMYWNTIIPRTVNEQDKNEIDVIVDTGIKLFFIECKTQVFDIKDLDKFRNVVKNFGGLGAKAVLVSYFKPTETVLEKCSDNQLSVFWFYDARNQKKNANSDLVNLLDKEYQKINPI